MIDKYGEYYTAVENDWEQLEFVPDNFKTTDLCHRAVKQSGTAIEFVPKRLITYDLCKTAIYNGASLKYIPEKYITKEFCLVAIEKKHLKKSVLLMLICCAMALAILT